jgi:K+-sensing histidine kinase KdpD
MFLNDRMPDAIRSHKIIGSRLAMKLSKFINSHMEEILAEWDLFARSLQPASTGMSNSDLRDHGKEILQAIARDINTAESSKQQSQKSKGLAPSGASGGSAAASHGEKRYDSGFTLLQLIAEYRAMRASVLRLWMPQITRQSSNDVMRFNEAIDQALSESALTFSDHTTRTRNTFLAILGHDLRSPLATMTMAGDYLTRPKVGTDSTKQVGARVKRSAATMTTMVKDLLEYTRTQLDGKIPITLNLADMKDICQAAVDDASAAHPECVFKLNASGELLNDFDGPRLQQVFSNLLNNAAQYRTKTEPVVISASGEADSIIVEVKNIGPAIPPESLEAIFNPLVQLSVDENQDGRPTTSLGLGLFIAREITIAHGGTIEAQSDATSGNVFTVRFPRTVHRND